MDLFTLILIPFVVGIFTNRVDALIIASSVENVLKRLHHNDKQVNQELEKILKLCFLSALQTIAIECHKELIKLSPVQRYRAVIIYPPEHRDELQWLDLKLKQLVKELKHVKQAKYVDIPFKSLDEIASLLTSESQLLETGVQAVKEKLIAEALNEEFIPECYAAKVKTGLFEKVRENFTSEIKHNPLIREIFEVKLLANININLAEQKLKTQDLEESWRSYQTSQLPQASEARRTVKLELDVENLDAARLEVIIQHLQKLLDDGSIRLQRIEEGCMELVFDGSQKGLDKLDNLFKSGQLTEILGIPVQDVIGVDSNVGLNKTLVNLSQWLQNIIEAGWQTVEEVLGETDKLVFARSGTGDQGVLRAQQIDLEMQAIANSLALVVAVQPKADHQRDIRLQVYPISSKTLPQGLKCIVLDTSGKNLLEVQAKNTNKSIQLNISGKPGEQFSVQIQLGDASTKRNFVI
ncbi:DUF1822 family protein [Komarekiella sp. 'clone 1']|uniref:DUF1822 family protein n=1 Tax=Komarekiella delphini-convector SJRDD-AB1 TaxID=2593771 RepID=A0AA40VRV4_9NOST|nr:DUF1822 family protein [Komarekiella delphini-convector]MBD6616711.1 DUF1822 family protein [Komarekiella delphini-convector SJRDD-AB1]